jgi:chromosome segregation ATPase
VTRVFAYACVLGAVLALAACGGSGNSSSESTTTTSAATTTTAAQSTAASRAAYANGICGALLTWKNSLTSVASQLKGGNFQKGALQSAANTVSSANKQLADDVDALGTPAVGGSQAKTAMNNLSKQLRTSADQIQSAAKGVTNTQSAVAAVSTASTALLQMSTDISSAITQLQSLNVAQGWKQAFANSASCKSLNKSS